MNGKKFIAYGVASGVILLAGSIMPEFALATMIAIFVATVLAHSNQLTVLGSYIKVGTK